LSIMIISDIILPPIILFAKKIGQNGLKGYWLLEYDEAVNKGVKPRQELQKTYKYIQ